MSESTTLVLQQLSNSVDKIEVKQDKMLQVVIEQNEILAKMQVIQQQHHDSLDEHMKRTMLAEDRLLRLETKDHQFQSFIKGVIWVSGIAASLAGLIIAYFRI